MINIPFYQKFLKKLIYINRVDLSILEKCPFRANAFESQYRENAPRRRYAAPKSNAFTLSAERSVLSEPFKH